MATDKLIDYAFIGILANSDRAMFMELVKTNEIEIDFKKTMKIIVKLGNTSLLTDFNDLYKTKYKNNELAYYATKVAIENNKLGVLIKLNHEILNTIQLPNIYNSVLIAAEKGYIGIIKYVFEENLVENLGEESILNDVAMTAAEANQLTIVEWLFSKYRVGFNFDDISDVTKDFHIKSLCKEYSEFEVITTRNTLFHKIL
jgi:hypothetical protein